MRVNLRRRIRFVAALIVPAVAVLALSASPALAALPRYGRLVLGTNHTLSPVAILAIVVGTAVGLGLLVVSTRRRSHIQDAAVSTIPVGGDASVDAADRGRKAA